MFDQKVKSIAFDNVCDRASRLYVSSLESQSKDYKSLFFELIDYIEMTEYAVDETLSGHEENR